MEFTKEDLQYLAESILGIYAPQNFNTSQIKILAKSEVERWEAERNGKEKE